jgi:uncharacterized protein YjbI with pentapeptide repeats
MTRFCLALWTTFLFAVLLSVAHAGTTDAVAAIRAGNHDCPHCVLKGADLTNQCVKGGNLSGADFDDARLVLACMSNANFRSASFRHADLSGANLANSRLDDADLSGANLSITSIKGTDLTRAKGLTQAQLDQACGDGATRVPAGMIVRRCE